MKRIYLRYKRGKRVGKGQHYKVGGKNSKYIRGPKPKQKFLSKEKQFKSIYVQDKKTGLMKGRKSVPGKGDLTGVFRDDTGRIWGRTKKYKV